MFLTSAIFLAFLITQLGTREDSFVTGTAKEKEQLRLFFHLLNKQKNEDSVRFTLVDEITRCLKAQGDIEKVNLFLTTYVSQNSQDPFNAYHLFKVAENYRNTGAYLLAIQYYERVLSHYYDLINKGESLHYQCLRRLISLEERPLVRKRLFEELQRRFNDKMTTAETFYQWGRAYETLGLWNKAIDAYKTFLLFPDALVKGEPKASQRIRSLVEFSQVDRRWVRPELDKLTADLKKAILSNNISLLESLRAKVGFFTLSWDNSEVTDILSEAFDTRVFLRALVSEAFYKGVSSVHFSSQLDQESTEDEAYLRSSGWNYRIPILYFYFRRIDYPADLEIDGSWEWAGIFFGDKP